MKTNPCDREAVTLLACSALDNAEADRTRRHLQQCAACRDYFRQLSEVCASHSNAARQLPTAEVSVRLGENGRSVTAKAADPDTLVASTRAYLAALNKLMVKRNKGVNPQTLMAG